MRKKNLIVRLTREDEVDRLIFEVFKDEAGNPLSIELSGEANAQSELKQVFSRLLEDLVEAEVKLTLEKDECKDNALFQMVADDYIEALNTELQSTREHYLKAYSELKLD